MIGIRGLFFVKKELKFALQCNTIVVENFKEGHIMGVTTIRLNEQEEKMFQSYAELTGLPLSTLMKQALTEKIEDFLDLQAGIEALQNITGESISLQDMMRDEEL